MAEQRAVREDAWSAGWRQRQRTRHASAGRRRTVDDELQRGSRRNGSTARSKAQGSARQRRARRKTKRPATVAQEDFDHGAVVKSTK